MSAPSPRYRCPLAPLQPTPPDPEAIKRDGCGQQGILVIAESDRRLDRSERAFLRRLGERLYSTKDHRHD